MALDVVGKLGRVTADITPGHLGEVAHRGPPGHGAIPRPRGRQGCNDPQAHPGPGGRQPGWPDRRGCSGRHHEASVDDRSASCCYPCRGRRRRRCCCSSVVFRMSWRVAEPDEALIISGLRRPRAPEGAGETMGFRIVTGRGALRRPGPDQGAHPLARGPRERDRRAVRQPAEDPARPSRRRRLQGRRRLPLDRQRGPALPRPARRPSSSRRSRTSSSATCARSPAR